jgi:hypothetical protein
LCFCSDKSSIAFVSKHKDLTGLNASSYTYQQVDMYGAAKAVSTSRRGNSVPAVLEYQEHPRVKSPSLGFLLF